MEAWYGGTANLRVRDTEFLVSPLYCNNNEFHR